MTTADSFVHELHTSHKIAFEVERLIQIITLQNTFSKDYRQFFHKDCLREDMKLELLKRILSKATYLSSFKNCASFTHIWLSNFRIYLQHVQCLTSIVIVLII